MRVRDCFTDAKPLNYTVGCAFSSCSKVSETGSMVKKTSFQPVDCISKNIMNLLESFSLNRVVWKTKNNWKIMSSFHHTAQHRIDQLIPPSDKGGVNFRGGRHGFCRWHLATLGELLASSSWKRFGVVWICGLRFLDFSGFFGCHLGNNRSPEIMEQKVLIANADIF